MAAPQDFPINAPPHDAAPGHAPMRAGTRFDENASHLSTVLGEGFEERLQFHGRGSEYFRIWIVHLFFTLLTLGVYSAWAKVRKARWFAQHTSLAGDRFDFHGDPKRVLVGRLIGLSIFAAWSYSFWISKWLGVTVFALLCIVGPLLFASAQRFRLVNTSWRGLRFDFTVPRREVYAVIVPLILLWAAGTVLQALDVNGALVGAAGLATFVGMPWAHARLKHLQHDHASFGDKHFAFTPAPRKFYRVYGRALGVLLLSSVVIGALAAIFAGSLAVAGARGSLTSIVSGIIAFAAVGLIVWTSTWAYFAARLQQVVWGQTSLDRVQFRGDMKGGRMWRLVMGNMLLTLLTAGLYWPFAAVAIARYRIESIVAHSTLPLTETAAGIAARNEHAAGDAALDFFGLDVGW